MKAKRLLITGAAGGLGQVVREGLAGYVDTLRLSDIADLGSAAPGEEIVRCDLADREAVDALVAGCDAILHLGGISVEAAFDSLLRANILGTYNLYEAARQHGVRRILFASSNHATGFHRLDERLDETSQRRPDSLYGVSKCFGEDLARLYFDKFGIETVSVRIGSYFAEPTDRRMLATWLSPRDFVSLCRAVFDAAETGYLMLYAASANRDQRWSNAHAAQLDWKPLHSSEPYRAAIEASVMTEEEAHALHFQGGHLAASWTVG